MKPAPFEYVRATTLADAVEALSADEDAKVLAGGQSLIPLLALRLARPSVLVDIGGLGLDSFSVSGLGAGSASGAGAGIRQGSGASSRSGAGAGIGQGSASGAGAGGEARFGAMVRQRRLELDPAVATAVPLLADAARQVGHPATRNRGTLGGSLAHADPASELPAVAVALGGRVVVTGPAGSREIACCDLAEGSFMTTIAADEVLTEVVLPAAGAGHGAAWCEWAPREYDFAEAGVGVAVDVDPAGACVRARAAACGIGGRPVDLSAALDEAGVPGAPGPAPALLAAVARASEGDAAAGGADEDKARLTGLLAARALHRAFGRALVARGGGDGRRR